MREEIDLRRGFHKDSEGTRTSRRLRCFPYVFMRLSPSEMIFKLHATSKRKDNSPPATLPWTLRCQLLYSLRFPTDRFRNFRRIPFPPIRRNYHQRTNGSTPTFQGGFPLGLGPTYSCRTKLHMKTYPSSEFCVLNRIFATTTKICTRCTIARRLTPNASTRAPRSSYATLAYTTRQSAYHR